GRRLAVVPRNPRRADQRLGPLRCLLPGEGDREAPLHGRAGAAAARGRARRATAGLGDRPAARRREQRCAVSAIEIRGRSEHVAANVLRHRILSYGDSHDRDHLLLPGITSPAVTADFVAVHLADMGYRVVVPDARGRGETDRAQPGGYRLTDYAADVAALVDVLGLRDPVIVGHSMGARTAAA